MNPDDKELTEAMRLVAERLAQARWLKKSYVSQKDLKLHFSEAGQAGLQQMATLFRQIGWPATMDEVKVLHWMCQQAAAEPPTHL
jgi:hypothetical protein